MRKVLYSLLMLLASITSMTYAQQEANTITEWDGSNKKLKMRPDSLITFSYKATENGTLYIYAKDQDVSDNVHVSIWGGWYHDGSYDSDSPLQEAGSYENGVGVYGWIKVFTDDEIRFTLSTPEKAEGIMAIFTLKSAFFSDTIKGDSWEQPITLTENKKATLPVYKNYDVDYLKELSYATFGRFVAPSDGVASIYTDQYLVYYIEEELYGSVDEPLKYVSQDISTDDHEFVVEKDKAYIIIVPNSRPADVTFKMTSTRLGENCKAPIEVEAFPATLDLVKGNNFYHLDLSNVGEQYILEMSTAADWSGSITYLSNCDYESDELQPVDIKGAAISQTLNLDPLFVGNELIINYNVTSPATVNAAATLTLREANEGESLDKAKTIGAGETTFSSQARDYWFVYTSNEDVELSITTTGTLKHALYSRSSGNIMNGDNIYRLSEGQTIYICVTATEGEHSIAITEKSIEEGDYCDMPIVFALGDNVIIKDRGDDVMNYRQFTAEKSGFAIFETTSKNVIDYYWSIYFRTECSGKTISYVREDITDNKGNVTARSYKIPVTEGTSYLFEIMSFANEGADVVFTSRLEEANEGDICATAIAIAQLGDTITIDNTPESTVWHKYVADRTGFYTTYAKLGRGSNLKVKVGDCEADEINGADDNRYSNAYMAGYKCCKVYVEQGQTLYICTTINADPGDTDGTNYYIVPTFAEARPGERFVDPIAAEPGVEYTLTSGSDGYDTWYIYTLPSNKEVTITISSTVKNYCSLVFYTDEKTSLSAYKEDFTQTSIVNEEGITVGKSYLFAAAETERTIYIKTPVSTITEPVIWKIVDTEEDTEEDVEEDVEADIENLKSPLIVTLYPTPSDGLFHVSVPTAVDNASVTVTTLSGSTVHHSTLTDANTAVDLRGKLNAGIYLVTVKSNHKIATSKLIIK